MSNIIDLNSKKLELSTYVLVDCSCKLIPISKMEYNSLISKEEYSIYTKTEYLKHLDEQIEEVEELQEVKDFILFKLIEKVLIMDEFEIIILK